MSDQQKHPTAHILVVDDEPTIRLTLEAILKRHGYSVTTAENGTEALARLSADSFDLLLLDLMLPDMSGDDIARQAQVIQPKARILILTGSTPLFGHAEEPVPDRFVWIEKTLSPLEVVAHVTAALTDLSTPAS